MAYCAKCGKETKDGQIYCDSCLAEMEDNSYSDLFTSLDEQSEEENTSDDDFTKILEELQGPREEINDPKEKKADNSAPSTVSDVFSDAVSAISSLEDELEDMVDLGGATEHKEQEKKKGFFARLFSRKSKQTESKTESTDELSNANESEQPMTKKALRKAKKEKAKQEKAELAKKKEAEVKKAKEEKEAAKKSKKSKKSDAKQPDAKKAKSKKADAKKADAKKADAKKTKPKKEKVKKEKKKPTDIDEVIVEEDIGHFNIPALVAVFSIFIVATGYILLKTFSSSYNYSIEVASRKFDKQKYNQAFEEIYGLDVKEDDEELYDKIMTVMYVNKQLNSYNNYMGLDMYPEALDSLIKGLKRYETYIDAAKDLGITDDLDYVREQILQELKREFKLSEKKAMKLTKIEDKTEYSIKIYDIVLENTDYSNK